MYTIEKKGISLIGMNDNMGYGEKTLSAEDLRLPFYAKCSSRGVREI